MGAVVAFLAVGLYLMQASAFAALTTGQQDHTKLTEEIKLQLDSMSAMLTEKIETQLDSMQSEIRLMQEKFDRTMAFAASNCPPGFVYMPESESCYKVVTDARRNWAAASQKCQDLYKGAHLAVITTECEDETVNGLLRSEISNNPYMDCRDPGWIVAGNLFWIGAQRLNVNDCSSEFVWKLPDDVQSSMNFTYWNSGEPNCAWNNEACVQVWPDRQFLWNDGKCEAEICAVCEYNPHLQHRCL